MKKKNIIIVLILSLFIINIIPMTVEAEKPLWVTEQDAMENTQDNPDGNRPEKEPVEREDIKIDITESDCKTILGSTDPNRSPLEPAYYLDKALDLIKYLAIIILVVFTIKDFFGAIVSSDEDAIKGATKKSLKRLIMCIAIFVIPELLSYFLELTDVITTSTDPLCGIGGGA